MVAIKIVAVTACLSGVAHTYMAAEHLKKFCQKKQYRIKIETQGALGIENQLTQEDISNADVVVVACDINIEGMERFKHSRTVKMTTKKLLTDVELLQTILQKARLQPAGTLIDLG